MRILIDGDACPVIKLTDELAQKYQVELIIYVDLNHHIDTEFGQVISLDSYNQAVDMAIINNCQKDDIVITQDYGLAALVLGQGVKVINYNGIIYNDDNIDFFLKKRHLHAKMRRAGLKHPTVSKRTSEEDLRYKTKLEEEIKKSINLN